MSQLSFVVGGILIVIGVGGYVASHYVSPTALIPAASFRSTASTFRVVSPASCGAGASRSRSTAASKT